MSPPAPTELVTDQTISAAGPESTAPLTTRESVWRVLASFGLGPLGTDKPIPVDSPVGWAVLALARSRRFEQIQAEEAPSRPADETLTSQAVDSLGIAEDQRALADTSIMQLSAPLTVDAASMTTASQTRVQAKAAASQTTRDTKAPTVSLTAPAAGATVSGTVSLSATAADNVGVAGVQFLWTGSTLGAEDTSSTGLRRVVGHHRRRQRHAHADRSSPRRRWQHHNLDGGERHRQQLPDTTAPTVSLTAPATARPCRAR